MLEDLENPIDDMTAVALAGSLDCLAKYMVADDTFSSRCPFT